ncbi:MAG: ferrous iron transport protein B [Candidatus Sumerlaeia bacterium]
MTSSSGDIRSHTAPSVQTCSEPGACGCGAVLPALGRRRSAPPACKRIAVVGRPNVGKSVLFNALTGKYADVSNYPGTTVEVYRGRARLGAFETDIVDTPGMYSLSPITEEERVARRILLTESPDLTLHVIDAKNIEQLLPLTLQLIESDLRVVLVLNMMDEARAAGVSIDTAALQDRLGVPVVAVTAVTGEGLERLRAVLADQLAQTRAFQPAEKFFLCNDCFSPHVLAVARLLEGRYGLGRRMIAQLMLEDDAEIKELVQESEPRAETLERVQAVLALHAEHAAAPIEFEAAVRRQQCVRELLQGIVVVQAPRLSFQERLSRLMMHPLTGLPVLGAILYFGLYQFVGVFGAGTVVDFIESVIFEGWINPALVSAFHAVIPWAPLNDLFVGEYGVLTLGVRYAVALVLPIVTFFFVVFAIIEDSGYLPRLAMLIDRLFKKIGLSGRAVIPIVLGLGCDTMATLVTRTLPTRRERLISTVLLSLAIPCSAQLGLILALLAAHPGAMWVWGGVMVSVFLLIGWAAAQVTPGGRPSFYMDVPPLRLPRPRNVFHKTWKRVVWYFKETLPLFVLASALIWVGQITGLFQIAIKALEVPVGLIGLPPQTATIFLFGFFRRDYGAAGLYDLAKGGGLTGVELAVAAVALTLFLPCIAQFLINIKERGLRTGLGIAGFVLVLSFVVAFVLNQVLGALGVTFQ